MKTKKIISAGPLVIEAIYPRGAAHDAPRIRAGKKKLSSEAQKRMNAKHSYQKLELLLAANFVPGDWLVTFTYAPEALPETRAQANARLREFRRRLAARRKRHGRELRMVWATENVFDQGRWHHHAVLNNAGEDFAELRALWTWGSDVEISVLRIDRDHSFEAISRYLCKEARERPGLRSWSYTRSCRQLRSRPSPCPTTRRCSRPRAPRSTRTRGNKTSSAPGASSSTSRRTGAAASADRRENAGAELFVDFSGSVTILFLGK